MADYELVIRARRAVTPDGIRPATVAIRGGKIAALAAFSDAPDAVRVEELPGPEVLLPGVVDTVAARLRAGQTVVAFPEGTTWCGLASGPFYPAMFQAAVDTGRPAHLMVWTPPGTGARDVAGACSARRALHRR